MQKQGLERGGSWNPASGRGSHRAEGPLGSCVACRAGLNPRSLCTFKVAKMWARCPSPYRFSRLSEQWPVLPPLLFCSFSHCSLNSSSGWGGMHAG